MFSRTAEYAMRSMACLARHGSSRVSTVDLASQTGVPPNYLAKVLQLLAAAQLIAGRRGIGGGYQLARPPDEITLIDVVRAVHELDRIHACPLEDANAHAHLCPLHRILDKAAAAVIDILQSVTLDDLIRGSSNGKPLCSRNTSV